MEERLYKKLSACGVKKSQIETILKMPKNSLAGMMNGTRVTPEKWHDKLWHYIHTLEGRIIPAPDAPFIEQVNMVTENTKAKYPMANEETTFDGVFKKAAEENGPLNDIPLFDGLMQAAHEFNMVTSYLKEIGMTAEELIADHKRMAHEKYSLQTKEMIAYTGKNHAKEYNPNDNWRFKSKMGTKEKPNQE
jgi:hypothetical protein